ncbi:MAG: lamin tail domain-containing protein, partial [Myxococcales bacterium]|nr:lamin tail domain-containing protein [Myxococcales bacterium]
GNDEVAATDTTDSTEGDPVCGDGVRQGDEACDGSDLGGQSCQGLNPGFSGGTLACSDSCSFDDSGCTIDPGAPLLRLNEVTSDTVAAGDYANYEDVVELFNAGGAIADLSGAKLSDDPDFAADKTYTFPDGTTLGPGEHLVVYKDDGSGTGLLPFGLKSDGDETLTLRGADDSMLDQVLIPAGQATVSWCRLPDGTGDWTQCAPTFGASNSGGGDDCGNGTLDAGEECDGDELDGQSCADFDGYSGGELGCTAACSFDLGNCAEDAALVVVNELTSSGADEIELYNAGTLTADLSGWYLTDDLAFGDDNYDPGADAEELHFADGVTLAPGAWLVIQQGNGDLEHPFGISAQGDVITLLDGDLAVIDQVEFADGEADPSYCRMPDGGDWTANCDSSFGISNQ